LQAHTRIENLMGRFISLVFGERLFRISTIIY